MKDYADYDSRTIPCRMCEDEISYVRIEDMPAKNYFEDCLEHLEVDDLRVEALKLREEVRALNQRLSRANAIFGDMTSIACEALNDRRKADSHD